MFCFTPCLIQKFLRLLPGFRRASTRQGSEENRKEARGGRKGKGDRGKVLYVKDCKRRSEKEKEED